jgi:protein-disulfide isomerase
MGPKEGLLENKRMSSRFLCLVLILVAVVTAAVALVPLTLPTGGQGDAGVFDRRVRAYLLTHPEVIMEAVATLERRNTAARAQQGRAAIRANRAALHAPGALPVAGNAQGDVTVVEFFDYRCPYCRQAYVQVKALLAADPGVRLVFKEFPVLGPASVVAAKAAIAAGMQGKYIAFHEALMAYRGNLDQAAVMTVAASVGLNTARLTADMKQAVINTTISGSHALARKIGINGTPAFVIGDELVPGYISLDELKRLVAKARGK